MSFADIIKNRRKVKGLTQKDLASLLGCTDMFVSHMERGVSPTPIPMVEKLIVILDISRRSAINALTEDHKRWLESTIR